MLSILLSNYKYIHSNIESLVLATKFKILTNSTIDLKLKFFIHLLFSVSSVKTKSEEVESKD